MADTQPRRRRSSTPPDDRPPMPEDTPPKQDAKQETKQAPVNPPGKPIRVLQDKLTRFFVGMALPFAAAGDTYCAGILVTRGPIVAEAWANLAAESPAVKKMLEGMLKGGAWAGALSTTLAMVVPIAAHHGAPIPDFASAVIFGGNVSQPSQARHNEDDVIVTPPPARDSNNPTPGPAAYSTRVTNGNAPDPADPNYYAGLHPSAE